MARQAAARSARAPRSQHECRPLVRGRLAPGTRAGAHGARRRPHRAHARTMTSTCSQSAPASTMRRASLARLAKSEDRIDGQMTGCAMLLGWAVCACCARGSGLSRRGSRWGRAALAA